MARRTEDVVYGVAGQALRYRTPQGRPSAATFAVYRDTAGDDGEVEFEGVATIDPVETTLSAAAGRHEADPHLLELADVAAIAVGRKYLLSEDGRREWVEVVELGADYVRVRHQLQGDYTAAAAFVGVDATLAIDDDWAADLAHLSDLADPNPDYRVRWVLTVAGAELVAYSYFDLVRAPAGHGVTLADVDNVWHGLIDSLPAAHKVDQGAALIEAAWRTVRVALANAGLNDAALREDERVAEAVILAAIKNIAFGGHHPPVFSPGEFYALARENFERFMEQTFLAVRKVATAAGGDSAAARRAAEPFWVK